MNNNTLFNIIFIPRWGITGAALATGTSIVIINILKTIQVYHEFRMHPYNKAYWGNTLSITIGAVAVLGLQQLIHFEGVWGALAGGIVLFLFCALSYWSMAKCEDDKIIIKFIKQRLNQKKKHQDRDSR